MVTDEQLAEWERVAKAEPWQSGLLVNPNTGDAHKALGEVLDELRRLRRAEPEMPERVGYTVIPVLEFLWGRALDYLARNYVVALRPSRVRVSTGETKSDARPWRVTIYTDPSGERIRRIEQEVSVGLVGCEHGHDLNNKCPTWRVGGR